ncbi:HAD-IIB family hydrolase [Bacillus thuringiensis]|uniref:HAD-IIB family hydrolase n=1 Tax=Bacillus thuringiensis TaxID=1428 RepID=UPI00119D610E|nr:HAD-IIB family hydrolase [Bacillus thuringiensis]
MESLWNDWLDRHNVIVFDLDGTLINDEGNPFPEVIEGLRYLKSRGTQLFLATGRSVQSVKELSLPSEFIDLFVESIICNDGNVIYNRITESVKVLKSLAISTINELEEYIGTEADFILQGKEGTFASNNIAAIKYATLYNVKRSGIYVFKKQNLSLENIFLIIIFPRDLKRYQISINKIVYSNQVEFLNNKFNRVKILPKDTCKAEGLKMLFKKYKYSLEGVIAVGNGENDITLLMKCSKGVCVMDSPDSLKAVSNIHLQQDIGAFLKSTRINNLEEKGDYL